MAGVSNQPNIKPLIDKQTHAQTLEFKEVEQLVNGVSNGVEAIKSHTYAARVSTADIKDIVNLEFTLLKTLLSSEIDSNGDLTVANLASFKTAVVDEVQNSQNALNFTVSTSADAVLVEIEKTESKMLSGVFSPENRITANVNETRVNILGNVNSYVRDARDVIVSSINSYVADAKAVIVNSVESSKTAVLSEIKAQIAYVKDAIQSAVIASENRITANVNDKTGVIKNIQRGVVILDSEVEKTISIGVINLSKSMLLISNAGGASGHITAVNRITFSKSPAGNFDPSGIATIYWQVIE